MKRPEGEREFRIVRPCIGKAVIDESKYEEVKWLNTNQTQC